MSELSPNVDARNAENLFLVSENHSSYAYL